MLKFIDEIFESLYDSKYASDGIARSTHYSYEIKEMDADYIACRNKDCKVNPKTKAYDDIYDMTEQECIDRAIKDWNDR